MKLNLGEKEEGRFHDDDLNNKTESIVSWVKIKLNWIYLIFSLFFSRDDDDEYTIKLSFKVREVVEWRSSVNKHAQGREKKLCSINRHMHEVRRRREILNNSGSHSECVSEERENLLLSIDQFSEKFKNFEIKFARVAT